jgi:hypothetical protein
MVVGVRLIIDHCRRPMGRKTRKKMVISSRIRYGHIEQQDMLMKHNA